MKPNKTVFFYTVIVFIIFPNSTIAWSNGNSGNAYANNEFNYDYNDNFATHDWIAKGALDALLSSNQAKWQWLEDREVVYLLGTEAPDNSALSTTLDGTVISGFGDTTWHHVYFYENGTVYEDDAALRAKSCGDLANSYIENGKLELGAFYFGAMIHYISDLSMFSHTVENNIPPHNLNFDTYHSTIEGYVRTRTNEYNSREEFFQFSSFVIGNKAPYDAAIKLAWDTYNDLDNIGVNNAVWLHNNHFTGWAQNYANRLSDTLSHQEYYDRIENSLNNAIEASASALVYEFSFNLTDNTESKLLISSYNLVLTIIILFIFPFIIFWMKQNRRHKK